MFRLLTFFFITTLLFGCENNQQSKDTPKEQDATTPIVQTVPKKGCLKCHPVRLDKPHQLACSTCHEGNRSSNNKAFAHQGLIAKPAHPNNMDKYCGKCHEEQVNNVRHSLHATLTNSVNMVRSAFGAQDWLNSLTEIPVTPEPENLVELADDLLRRRCLRCHLYSSGDDYPLVKHATGCGSCHLNFSKDNLSHFFIPKPGDHECLQCHYGNRVGFDYHGRFEHDLGNEYQTPFTADNNHEDDYGVPYHNLSPDIHFLRGLICIDCHSGESLMEQKTLQNSITCRSCHDNQMINDQKNDSILKNKGDYFLRSKQDNKLHKIPLMTNPAHEKYNASVDCQVCHALWSFNDQGVHLFRSDIDDYDLFAHLLNQGSSEVSSILQSSRDFEKDDPEPTMSDKITGEKHLGLWYKGFGIRRWENIILGRDKNNNIRVMRPALDLHLSWIDEDENVRFDSATTTTGKNRMTPYTPHTTGKAGLFYRERIQTFLKSEQKKDIDKASQRPNPSG